MKRLRTTRGILSLAGIGTVIGSIIIDLFIGLLMVSLIHAVMANLGTNLSSEVNGILIFLVFLYTYLAYKNIVFSVGQWGNGLKRFSYNDIEDYSGKGTVYLVDNLPKSTLTYRTIVIVVWFILMIFILWLLGY